MRAIYEKIKYLSRTFLYQWLGRPTIYLGDYRALTRTIYGHKIFVDTRDISLTPSLLLNGGWEHSTVALFNRLLKPGFKIVDIGAHVGYYALLAAQYVGPSGHVYCFEANPRLCELLYETMGANVFLERVTIVNKAVYSQAQTLAFKIYKKYTGGSSIRGTEKQAEHFNDSVSVVNITATSLDDYFPKNTVIDVIKIDAEGAEPHILMGAKRSMTENTNIKIIMEFNALIMQNARKTANVIFNYITKELGFQLFIINNGVLTKTAYHELIDKNININILITRKP